MIGGNQAPCWYFSGSPMWEKEWAPHPHHIKPHRDRTTHPVSWKWASHRTLAWKVQRWESDPQRNAECCQWQENVLRGTELPAAHCRPHPRVPLTVIFLSGQHVRIHREATVLSAHHDLNFKHGCPTGGGPCARTKQDIRLPETHPEAESASLKARSCTWDLHQGERNRASCAGLSAHEVVKHSCWCPSGLSL